LLKTVKFTYCSLEKVPAFRYTLYVYKSSCRASPVKEFASRSIEHHAEKRLNAFTVCPSWEEGREAPEEMLDRAKCIPIKVR